MESFLRDIDEKLNRTKLLRNNLKQNEFLRNHETLDSCLLHNFNETEDTSHLRVDNTQYNDINNISTNQSNASIPDRYHNKSVMSFISQPAYNFQRLQEELSQAVSMVDLLTSNKSIPIEKLETTVKIFLFKLKKKIRKFLIKSASSNVSMSVSMLPPEKMDCIRKWLNSSIDSRPLQQMGLSGASTSRTDQLNNTADRPLRNRMGFPYASASVRLDDSHNNAVNCEQAGNIDHTSQREATNNDIYNMFQQKVNSNKRLEKIVEEPETAQLSARRFSDRPLRNRMGFPYASASVRLDHSHNNAVNCEQAGNIDHTSQREATNNDFYNMFQQKVNRNKSLKEIVEETERAQLSARRFYDKDTATKQKDTPEDVNSSTSSAPFRERRENMSKEEENEFKKSFLVHKTRQENKTENKTENSLATTLKSTPVRQKTTTTSMESVVNNSKQPTITSTITKNTAKPSSTSRRNKENIPKKQPKTTPKVQKATRKLNDSQKGVEQDGHTSLLGKQPVGTAYVTSRGRAVLPTQRFCKGIEEPVESRKAKNGGKNLHCSLLNVTLRSMTKNMFKQHNKLLMSPKLGCKRIPAIGCKKQKRNRSFSQVTELKQKKPVVQKARKRKSSFDEVIPMKKKREFVQVPDKTGEESLSADSFHLFENDDPFHGFNYEFSSPGEALSSIRKKNLADATDERETPPAKDLASFMESSGKSRLSISECEDKHNSVVKKYAADPVAKKLLKAKQTKRQRNPATTTVEKEHSKMKEIMNQVIHEKRTQKLMKKAFRTKNVDTDDSISDWESDSY